MTRDVYGYYRADEDIKDGALVGFNENGKIVNFNEPLPKQSVWRRIYLWLYWRANDG